MTFKPGDKVIYLDVSYAVHFDIIGTKGVVINESITSGSGIYIVRMQDGKEYRIAGINLKLIIDPMKIWRKINNI